MRLVFIAGKFSGANAWEIACNVHEAEAAALRVAQLGGMPVVPHSLGRSMFGTLPEAFWRAGCITLLARCDAILLLPSWIHSDGAAAEAAFARQHGIRRLGPAQLRAPNAELARWFRYPVERGQSLKDAISAQRKAAAR